MEDLQTQILEALAAGPKTAAQVAAAIADVSTETVQEAIWRLLDAGEIRVNWSTQLESAPPEVAQAV